MAVIAFHFLAGAITGSLFAVRTLLMLVAFVLLESVVAAFAYGIFSGLWCLAGLIALQVGYLGGIYVRSVLEHAGIADANVRRRQHS